MNAFQSYTRNQIQLAKICTFNSSEWYEIQPLVLGSLLTVTSLIILQVMFCGRCRKSNTNVPSNSAPGLVPHQSPYQSVSHSHSENSQRLIQPVSEDTFVNERHNQDIADTGSLRHPPPAYQPINSTVFTNGSSPRCLIANSELLQQAPPSYYDACKFKTYEPGSDQTEQSTLKDRPPTYYATIARETEV